MSLDDHEVSDDVSDADRSQGGLTCRTPLFQGASGTGRPTGQSPPPAGSTPQPRKFTARMVRETLLAAGRDLTSEELAERLGCTVDFVKSNVVRWGAVAIGYRTVRDRRSRILGWRHQSQDDPGTHQPATPTVDELEARIAELEAQVLHLGGVVHRVATHAATGEAPTPQPRSLADRLDEAGPSP